MSDTNLTPVEERARAAALAEFDREAEIVLARWRKWLETHPIAAEDEDDTLTIADAVMSILPQTLT